MKALLTGDDDDLVLKRPLELLRVNEGVNIIAEAGHELGGLCLWLGHVSFGYKIGQDIVVKS